MDYGKAIRTVRAARGLSQKDLAAQLGLDSSYVSLIEGKKRVPSVEVLERAATVLGVPLFLLMLLAAGKSELRGINDADAHKLGRLLMESIISSRKKK